MEPVEINNLQKSFLQTMNLCVEEQLESDGNIQVDVAEVVLILAKAYGRLYQGMGPNALNNLENKLLRKMLSLVKTYFSTNIDGEIQADAADVVLKLAETYKILSKEMDQKAFNNLQRSLLNKMKSLLNINAKANEYRYVDVAMANVLSKLVETYKILFNEADEIFFDGSNGMSLEGNDGMFFEGTEGTKETEGIVE